MKAIVGILLCVAVFLLVTPAGEAFRAFPPIFFFVWLVIPLAAIAVKYSKYKRNLSKQALRWIRIIAVGMALGLSFLIFANFDFVRDEIGYKNVKGYHSEYYRDIDQYGRPAIGVDIDTSDLLGRIIVWVFECVYLILCIGIPILTWKQLSFNFSKHRKP